MFFFGTAAQLAILMTTGTQAQPPLVIRHYPPFKDVIKVTSPPTKGVYAGEGQLLHHLMHLSRGAVIPEGPCDADLYVMPFSCTSLRMTTPNRDAAQIVTELYVQRYMRNVRLHYPCFNRSHGTDHLFVCCHDMGRSAINRAAEESLDVRNNVIWVGYSADTAQTKGKQVYVHGRDISLPLYVRDNSLDGASLANHINPDVPRLGPLAFFAGSVHHGPVRKSFSNLKWTSRDKEKAFDVNSVLVFDGRHKRYGHLMRSAKFCLCPRGFRGWSPRVGESILAGCVPVVLANGYALPLQGYLAPDGTRIDWNDFSVIHDDRLPSLAALPARLSVIAGNKTYFNALRANLSNVRHHFLWHDVQERVNGSHTEDAVGMILRELQRRHKTLPSTFR